MNGEVNFSSLSWGKKTPVEWTWGLLQAISFRLVLEFCLKKMKRLLFRFRTLRQARAIKRLVVVAGLFVTVSLLLKTFTVPSDESRFIPREDASITSLRVGKLSLSSDSRSPTDSSLVVEETEDAEFSDTGSETRRMDGDSEEGNDSDDDIGLDEEGDTDKEFSFDLGDGVMLKKGRDPVGGFITLERVTDPKHKVHIDKAAEEGDIALVSDSIRIPNQSLVLEQTKSLDDESVPTKFTSKALVFLSSGEKGNILVNPSGQVSTKETLDKDESSVPPQSGSTTLNANFTGISSIPLVKKKRRMMPPVSVSEMNRLLHRNRASYRAMRPRWSSVHDKELLAVKAQIQNAPMVKTDRKLYAPVFRNISTFKRSYELMERTLKVYVYKEGQKPIFHEPLLRGIYASEGWFMKQMESNKQYTVRNPKKAHLFYMPFSSRLLQFALYVRNSHSRKNMEQHLSNYVDSIASKYPFWNRTGGADHFLAACHDWAPSETRHTMARAIRALCVADLREGFQLGKDVSLPETYVRSSKNPLRDLGGRPAGSRSILAFFAGNLHGRLRPVLLRHWGENRDPDMKIFGPLPRGAGRKAVYANFMKNSKYCLCPRGYEANSPRVIESIFFECVPVIISDNYVPPLFGVLNWEAFSVVVPEEDVPRLREILASIPEEKYVSLQEGVRRVQQHFLWHTKPVKYDLFHMILHSIWFNRVHNVRTR
ncbi:putative glycosyltransferase [Iris pallida]|uniref:Glycosyltransferase n=1 Tax=Iris pallida TaxID=29817 RepID=A0AAX6E664_IRIPA|nr:putative glycosyltransferase [Iris pallida]